MGALVYKKMDDGTAPRSATIGIFGDHDGELAAALALFSKKPTEAPDEQSSTSAPAASEESAPEGVDEE